MAETEHYRFILENIATGKFDSCGTELLIKIIELSADYVALKGLSPNRDALFDAASNRVTILLEMEAKEIGLEL